LKRASAEGARAFAACGSLSATCSVGSLWGLSHEQILADYPELTESDIRACLAYAADRERRLVTTAK
jgi:hypothetical protein